MVKRGDETVLRILIASLVVIVVALGIYFFIGGGLTGLPVEEVTQAFKILVYHPLASQLLPSGTATLQGSGGTFQGTLNQGVLGIAVPYGTYTLTVQLPGYSPNPYTQQVTVDGNTRAIIVRLLLNSDTPASSALLTAWSFNESGWNDGESEAVRESLGRFPGYPNLYSGTARGGIQRREEGVYGSSASFDGIDDYIEIPQYAWITNHPVSIMFWLHVNSSASQDSGILGIENNSNDNRFGVFLGADKKLYWDYGSAVGSAPNDGRVELDYSPYFGRWVHVTLVSGGNGGNFKGIYINGELKAQESNSDGPDIYLPPPLTLGRARAHGIPKYFNGSIDELYMYLKVLSGAEIQSEYARQRAFLIGKTDASGLIGRWTFQSIESNGQVKDVAGVNHGIAKGGASVVGGGIDGNALSFDGVDDEIVIPNAPVLSPQQVSVSGWFKTTSLTAGDVTASWVSKRDAFVFGPWSDGRVSFFAFLNGKYEEVKSNETTKVKEGVWQHWVATYDGSALTLYLNGTQAAKQTVSGSLGTSGDLYFGHDYVANAPTLKRFFNGMMDEVQVYDKALTADEVKALHTAQLSRLAVPAALPKILNACGRISEAGTYVLEKTLQTGSGTCLDIEASNVVVEGKDFGIEGVSSDPLSVPEFGIRVRGQNVTVKDIRVEGFGVGVLLQNATGASLSKVRASNNLYRGASLEWTSRALVTNSIFDNNQNTGMLFVRSSNNTIRDSTFRSNQGYGIYFSNFSLKNTIEAALFSNNSREDFFSDETSKDNRITRRSAGDVPTTPQVIQPEQLRGAGYTKTMNVGESLLFRVNATTHNLTVDGYTSGQLKITIKSHPQNFTLKAGEAQKVDLNHDNVYDLSVLFASVTLGQPKLTLQAISEKVGSGGGGGILLPGGGGRDNRTGITTNATTKNETKKDGEPWDQTTWIVVIAVLVVFIIVVIIAIVYALRNRGLSTQEQRFYRPEPHSSVLQPGSGFGQPNFGGP